MNYLRQPELLGPTRRTRMVEILQATDAQRARSDALGHTGNGAVEQLMPGSGYTSAELTTLREVMASACYAATADAFGLPDPNQLTPQVFPVWMRGSVDQPPGQRPHVDNRDGTTPLVTAVYYAQVSDTDGGEILIGTGPDQVVVQPVEDDLVAFAGDTVHAVVDLRAGQRLSVVSKFYLAIGQHA